MIPANASYYIALAYTVGLVGLIGYSAYLVLQRRTLRALLREIEIEHNRGIRG